MIRTGLVGLGLAFTSTAAIAADADATKEAVEVSFTDDLEIRYWINPYRLPGYPDNAVRNYIEQVNRLTANMSLGAWSIDTQIDQVALFANRYRLDGELVIENAVVGQPGEAYPAYSPLPGDAYANVEKIRLVYERPAVALQLGDSYAAFGRGIALNLNRNVDIDIDTSIQGVKMLARPGAWDITALMGQLNRQQVFQDNPNMEIPQDRRHLVAGVRAERFGLGPANIGVHGVAYNFLREPGLAASGEGFSTTPDAIVGGGTLELMGVAGLDVFLEGDLFHYDEGADLTVDEKSSVDAEEDGHALYGSMSAYPGRFVVLVEGKRYLRAERINALTASEFYEVSVGPSLEYDRALTEDSGAALNSSDIVGGRVQVDWSAIPGTLVPYLSAAYFVDRDLGVIHFNKVPERILHPMVGLEWLAGERSLLWNAGYRTDQRTEERFGADRQLHSDVVLQFPLKGEWYGNFNLYAEHVQWGVNDPQQKDFVEVEASYTMGHGAAYALTLFCDYTSDHALASRGNLFPALFPNSSAKDKPLYGAVELQWKPDPATTLKAFYGAYKGGIRCAGGQCRQLPGFNGARVAVQSSF